jgi:uncharacterized protein YlxP (DUF503 family)
MTAKVGLLTVQLTVPDARTLKDKRQVVRSLLGRATDRFNVAAAEVARLDSVRRAELAFCSVSNEGGHVREMLDAVLHLIEAEPRAEIEDSWVEMF